LIRHKSPRSRALQNLSPTKKKSVYEKHHFGLSNNRVNLSPLDHLGYYPQNSSVFFAAGIDGVMETNEDDPPQVIN